MRSFFTFAFQRSTVVRSLKLSTIVGSSLNIINQGDMILGGVWENINYFKLALTYVVPYLVSTYSTASALIDVLQKEEIVLESFVESAE
jgi:hypothetical protein